MKYEPDRTLHSEVPLISLNSSLAAMRSCLRRSRTLLHHSLPPARVQVQAEGPRSQVKSQSK